MFKTFSALMCLITLVLSADSRAVSDNLTLTKYMNSSEVPSSFLGLGGGQGMVNKSYRDDDDKSRTDKIYYTTSHSYNSSYRAEDVARLMNPADGRLGNLFEDTSVSKSSGAGYSVMMEISTPIKRFNCASTLNFKNFKSGNKNVFVYHFSNFNMVFTDMVIQVEVESVGANTKIKLSQIAAIKGSTYSKLKSFLAVGKFEKALKENIRKFKDGIGGV
jgi:hypothetical protein